MPFSSFCRAIQFARLKGLVLIAVAIASSTLFAQSKASATGGGQSFWIGGEYSNMESGFPKGSSQRMSGIGTFFVFNFSHAMAVEGEANFLRFNGFYDETQTSLLAGPRYTFLHNVKWSPYAQVSFGGVRTKFPFDIGTGDSFAIAPAAGVGYRLNRQWMLHAQYEYQYLTNSPDFTDEAHYGMRPNGFQIGVAYRIHRWGR